MQICTIYRNEFDIMTLKYSRNVGRHISNTDSKFLIEYIRIIEILVRSLFLYHESHPKRL